MSLNSNTRVLSSFMLALSMYSCTNKAAYINPIKLVDGYHGAAPRRQELAAKTRVWQANLDSLTREFEAQPPAQQAAKEQEFLRYRESVQQQAQREDARLQQEVLAEINAYIKQYGKDKGYNFIFGATNQGNIVYAAEGTDLTEQILVGLNKQYDQRHGAARP